MKIIKILTIILLSVIIRGEVYSQSLVPDKERERVANEVIQAIREQSFSRIDALIPRYKQTYMKIIPNRIESLDDKGVEKLLKDNYDKFKELFNNLMTEMKQDTIDPKHVQYVSSEVRRMDARKYGTADDVCILGIYMKEGTRKFSLPLLMGIVDQRIFLIGMN